MKKAEGSNKQERIAALLWLAGAFWNERRHRKCPVIFSPFSVLLGTPFIFKTRWVTVKEVFLLSITWLLCKRDEAALIIMSVSELV